MAELALLELDRGDALAMHRAAEIGDADALAFFEHLWDSYCDTGTGLACFLCDAEAAFPPHTEIVGAPDDASKVVAAPLCAHCRDLPKMIRWGRCLKMLRVMHKVRTGKDVHYQHAPAHQRRRRR